MTRFASGRPVVLLALWLSACTALVGGESSESRRPWGLRSFGSLRAMFHESRTGAVVALDDLLPNERLYGVGALSGLRGEVTIVRGVPHVAYPSGDAGARAGESACLLVVAEVGDWIEVTTVRAIAFADLDEAVARLAGAAGVDTDHAFPFLVEGEVADLRWHVIDGSRLAGGGTSHADHLGAASKHRRDSARALLVGFHSPRDHGVFTHMGSNTHVHAVLGDGAASGHVDHVTLPAGTSVRFPSDRHRERAKKADSHGDSRVEN